MIFVLENGKNTVGLSVVYWIHTSRSEFTKKKKTQQQTDLLQIVVLAMDMCRKTLIW